MADDKEAILSRFMGLFSGIGRAYGTYEVTGESDSKKGKLTGKAVTVRSAPTPEHYASHLSGDRSIGIPPLRDDGTVVFGAIDIDVYDGLDFVAIEERAGELGLPLVFCRTKSGGLHAYLFTSEPVPAKLLRDKLTSWAAALGFGGVEVFPKQVRLASESDVGNWINLPYFHAKQTQRPGVRLGKPQGLREWLDWAESRRVDEDTLIAVALPGQAALEGAPPCLQTLGRAGFPEGNRNIGLFNLGVFARLRYGDDWQERVDEFNRTLVSPPLPSKEVVMVVKQVGRKEYFYTCNQTPLSSHCDKETCRTCKFGIGEGARVSALESLTKLVTPDGELVAWIATVDGCRVDMTTDDIMLQAKFRRVCFERLNKLPKLMTPASYERMISSAIEKVEELAAPQDASPEGQFSYHLETFVTERPPGKKRDELLMGKTWMEDGRCYFRAADLIRYLDQQHFRGFTPGKVYTVLRRTAGVEHHQFNILGKCVQCWSIAAPSKQTEDFTPVAIGGSVGPGALDF